MSLGWGYMPMQAPSAEAATAEGEGVVDVVQLVTTRASAPSLGDFLAELHGSEVLSDITICSEDGQAIKCHKLVLIRWSAVLRRMLCGDMREAREKHITLHGVDGEVLAAFIRFLYTCNCSIVPDKLVGLCAMADQYDVTLLQQLCMDAIRMHAPNHRCCCLFYKAAKEIQQQEIMQLAWEQLASNLNSLVRQHDVFVQLEFEDVLRLLSRSVETAQGTATTSQAAPPAAAAAAGAETAAADLEWAATAGWQGWPAVDPGSNPPAQQVAPNRVVLWGEEDQRATQARQQQAHQQPQQPQQPHDQHGLSRDEIAAAYQQLGRPYWAAPQQQLRRPEYALFLAAMAWLHHSAERQQHKQQLYECFDFKSMSDNELVQMRRNPYVQGDADLKEMLLDAFESRCVAHSQQPVYHMAPLPRNSWSGWGNPW